MEKSSFNFLSKVQDIKLDQTLINGSTDGLRSFLNIFIAFTFRKPSSETTFEIVSVSAKLKFQNPNLLLSETNVLTGYSFNRNELDIGDWFNFILDEKAIYSIEKYRKDDVPFVIELTVVALMKTEVNFQNGVTIKNSEGALKETARLHFSIVKSNWVEKILSNLGYQNLKLIEIPLNHKTLVEAYDDIIFEFNKAEEYFNQKDYNKCVAHCRHTLDALTRNLKKIKTQVSSETSFKWLENIDTATLTWIDELNKSNTALSSKTHHSGQKKDFSRQEAESIYLVILGLLNFIAHIK
ncbi:MAG: hypothetical protein JWP12_2467 [Bacteroidetes bacterium]|nr:hypothetical protein [Bacteroidota bacterium]